MGKYSIVETSLLDAIDAIENLLVEAERNDMSNSLQEDASQVLRLLKAIDTEYLLGHYHTW